jgi:NADH pyrophosphatase NudC (nudix superfamily)
MTREEKINQLNDIFAEINEDDNAVCYLTSEDNELIESAIEALSQEPCYNPDEWCRTCSEYDQDKHCCSRYNKVIRNAVEEIKQPKVGHWIEVEKYSDGKHKIKCSECRSHIIDRGHANSYVVKEKYKYCPRCGAKMIELQESEE